MTLTSRKNDVVRRFRGLLRDKALRDGEGAFIAEGDHLCAEAAKSGLEIRFALLTERAMEKYPETARALTERAAGYAVISEDIAEYISDTKAPQGLFAELCKIPQGDIPGGRLVLLDGVQDPGNVGTIIRTAEALGISGVLLSDKCADVYSPKTLRAAMGSVFRLPCIICPLAQTIERLRRQGREVYGAMLDDSAKKLGEVGFGEGAAVVIGSEGGGISDEVRAACTGGLYIPITGAESLNAAAAAAMIIWELGQ